VNGPGEAEGADLGVSLGRGRAHFFKHGEVVDTIPEDEIVDTVLEAIENWDEENKAGGDGGPEDKEEADAVETTGVTKPDLPTS
jgi:(E)-4-hydroxy-3-methylbut-2-enyl-diphosphate synthase